MQDILDYFLQGEIIVSHKPKKSFGQRLQRRMIKLIFPYVRYLSYNYPIPFIGELHSKLEGKLVPEAVHDAMLIQTMRRMLRRLKLIT